MIHDSSLAREKIVLVSKLYFLIEESIITDLRLRTKHVRVFSLPND